MAARSWEEDYERNQSKLRDVPMRCEHREDNGERCLKAGSHLYGGYFPILSAGVLCEKHRLEQQAKK